MEHLEKKSGQITIDSIRNFASQKTVREKLKTSDTFYIPTPDASEVEKILSEEEEAIDWLEAQLHQLADMGRENYLAQQLED